MGGSAFSQKQYDPGATDTEIKIGNFVPYSGPVSAFGVIGKTMDAYFRKINAEGGINGRKINFISYDDAYSPPKAVEQARKLVESDEVLLIFGALGTPSNTAIHKYMNARKVPQLFILSGATKWDDPKNFPWTMGLSNYQTETGIYAKYIMQEKPNAKIAVLYQNDDYGKDFLKGLKAGLGDNVNMIVAESSYEVSEPTVDSHIVMLKASGADVFVNITTPKFSAQAIKKMGEIDWKPMQFLNNVSAQIGSVLKPAGLENSQGIISATYTKDATDPQWKDDPAMKRFFEFLSKYFPEADRYNSSVMTSYIFSQLLVQVLKQAGDDLTRENVMKQAANLKALEVDGILPGIKVNTSPTNFSPIRQLQLTRFKGEAWERFGPVLNAGVAN
ncbi:MAG TPA: ABC transporter substrate-binding protein [Bradyrhizobium sp.]|nr:ABC transporter substrate-binding protein [Bradyrhizobium sp.]